MDNIIFQNSAGLPGEVFAYRSSQGTEVVRAVTTASKLSPVAVLDQTLTIRHDMNPNSKKPDRHLVRVDRVISTTSGNKTLSSYVVLVIPKGIDETLLAGQLANAGKESIAGYLAQVCDDGGTLNLFKRLRNGEFK